MEKEEKQNRNSGAVRPGPLSSFLSGARGDAHTQTRSNAHTPHTDTHSCQRKRLPLRWASTRRPASSSRGEGEGWKCVCVCVCVCQSLPDVLHQRRSIFNITVSTDDLQPSHDHGSHFFLCCSCCLQEVGWYQSWNISLIICRRHSCCLCRSTEDVCLLSEDVHRAHWRQELKEDSDSF